MLRVTLLPSGHRPGIYTGIARRAALEGWRLSCRADLGSVPGVALGLTPVRWMSLQWAADPALLWPAGRSAALGRRSEFSSKVVARLPSGGEGGGSPTLLSATSHHLSEESGRGAGGEEETRPSAGSTLRTPGHRVPVQQVN